MADIWFISDTHFGHANMLNFKRDDGAPLRDFNSVEEMDMTIIQNWSRVVKPRDIVYHLGDVAWRRESMEYLKILPGRKRLVRGNHDMFKDVVYTEHFQQVHGVKHMNVGGRRFVVSHVPLHPDCLDRWGTNIHGHLHANQLDDDRYINVSCECIDYTPVHIDELLPRGH